MATQEEQVGVAIDNLITKYQTTTIECYPYVSGAYDTYKQRTKEFDTAVSLIGRAIINPTKEQVSAIGSNESYDIAFLFSRLELIRKFPAADEGEWVDVDSEFTWFNRRFKTAKVHPSGQIGLYFTLTTVLGMTIQGARD